MTELRTPTSDGDLFVQRVREYAYDRPLEPVKILEAGCGSGTGLDLGPVECTVTGVDLDLPELRARTQARGDLDGWHLGDLRTVPMPPRVYDIVVVDHLLEHIAHAELVLDRFAAALKPGGLLLLRFRDRNSALGFLDRVLPHRLRRLLWPVCEPRPGTVYDRVASTEGMRGYCLMRGLVIAEEYGSREPMAGGGRRARLLAGLCRAVAALSRGRLTAAYSEVTLVIRKPENRYARVL